MDLKFDFSFEVRTLFDDMQECAVCHCNGSGRGGLSIHHIYGRVSDSVFNGVVLCGFCHERVTGSQDERLHFFGVTLQYLMIHKDDNIMRPFRPSPDDLGFIESHWQDFQHFDFSTVLE